MRRFVLCLAAGLACLPVVLFQVPASADTITPPVIGWETALPGLPTTTNPQFTGVPGCATATMACIDLEVSRMDQVRRAFGCDHRAVFATTYELLTIELRKEMLANPHLFQDPAWVIGEDATFTNMYFNSVSRYQAGLSVPAAWKTAFDTAGTGNANALQDMLLGINAHVQRDMPYMMASVGLHTPSGASRKADHDVMNEVLNQAFPTVVNQIAARFDPIANIMAPNFNTGLGLVGNVTGDQLTQAWREQVWRNAELLLDTAGTPLQGVIATTIETNAQTWATTIAGLPQYPNYRSFRDGYCQTHNSAPIPGA